MNLRVNSTHAYAERGLDAYSTPPATNQGAGSRRRSCKGRRWALAPPRGSPSPRSRPGRRSDNNLPSATGQRLREGGREFS